MKPVIMEVPVRIREGSPDRNQPSIRWDKYVKQVVFVGSDGWKE